MKEEFNYLEVIKKDESKRFELTIDGHIAFIDFTQRGTDVIKLIHNEVPKELLIHTEVPKELGGRGIAAVLVEKTLQYLEKNKFTLYPICPYVFAYIKKHPAWKRIVNENFKGFEK